MLNMSSRAGLTFSSLELVIRPVNVSVQLRGRKGRQKKDHREGFTKVVERVRNFGWVGQSGFAWKRQRPQK